MCVSFADAVLFVQNRSQAISDPPSKSSFDLSNLSEIAEASNAKISATGANLKDWTPSSYRARDALQQPKYEDQAEIDAVLRRMEDLPPLVFAGSLEICKASWPQRKTRLSCLAVTARSRLKSLERIT